MAYGRLRRYRAEARSAVVEPTVVRIGDSAVEAGCPVVDVLGRPAGTLAGAAGDFLVVSRGWFRPRLYVPAEVVREVRRDRLVLGLGLDTPAAARWSVRPRSIGRS